MVNNKKFKLSPPWIEYVNKVDALFKRDPEIKVEFNESTMNLCIYIDNEDKYEALSNLLPEEKVFGGVALAITLIPSNKKVAKDYRYYLKKLFQGNDSVVRIEDVSDVASNQMTFIVFKKEVVQYWIDNLGDIDGIRSTLMENIARDVFEDIDGVYFNTQFALLNSEMSHTGNWEDQPF